MSSKKRPGVEGTRRVPAPSRRLVGVVKPVAFCTAVVGSLLYLPLLATGLDSESLQLAFTGLVALNVVSVLLGHRYRVDCAVSF